MANTTIKEVYSKEETYNFALELGEKVKVPCLICLDGDLGVYEKGRLPFYHFDVYRIEEPEEMYEIGYEEYFFGTGVCLVEWASLIEELIPNEAAHILIEKDPEKGEDYRRIVIKGLL